MSLFLCLNEQPPSYNFQKTVRDDFAFYFDSYCSSAWECTSISVTSSAVLFTSMALNAAKLSIPIGCVKRQPQAWWSPEVEEAASKRRKAFAATHRGEDRQSHTSASRNVSSVITKVKAGNMVVTLS